MIFLTVGTQLPFDRLVKAVDAWAGRNTSVEVVAQVGAGTAPVSTIKTAKFFSPRDTEQFFQRAEVVVSHAGMGSILTALTHKRPIIIMPRSVQFGEHRNDHQMGTARHLGGIKGVHVAWSNDELHRLLDARRDLDTGASIEPFASGDLLAHLHSFIFRTGK